MLLLKPESCGRAGEGGIGWPDALYLREKPKNKVWLPNYSGEDTVSYLLPINHASSLVSMIELRYLY
jgi:hypothetical protein